MCRTAEESCLIDVSQVERGEPFKAGVLIKHGPVRSKHHTAAPDIFHVTDEIGWKAFQHVSASVDEEVGEFDGEAGHLVQPWKADMPADDRELREVEEHVFQVGIKRPVSERRSGPVWPIWVQNGTPSSTHAV